MPAEKQVEAVAVKLKELNPGFDGKVTHKVEDGVVTELQFSTDEVTDISPVRAFTALRVLDCGGTHVNFTRGNGRLADLSPLKGMNLAGLTQLNLGWTRVGDEWLAHLKGAKNLLYLHLQGTQVGDEGLAHLKECTNLTFLDLGVTNVGDAGLVHLRDYKSLGHLVLLGTQVGDAGLAHLKGCKNLTNLNLSWVEGGRRRAGPPQGVQEPDGFSAFPART